MAREDAFALKGGTAISLFVRDMPRLSVDIDLTYLRSRIAPRHWPRSDAAMLRIKERIEQGIPDAKVNASRSADENIVTKLIVRAGGVQIKIEVTPVLRGTAYDPVMMGVVPAVEDAFGFAEMQVVSFADLYAGKIVAALVPPAPTRPVRTCATCWRTKGSATSCAVPSLSISSATTVRWRRCWLRPSSP
ncbi:MAG: nucleotidyl transferase AbiEii/AbiGii toxin family protein [Sphingomonas sp.]